MSSTRFLGDFRVLRGTLILFLLFRTSLCQSLKGGHYKCHAHQEGQKVPVPLVNNIEVVCQCVNGILDNCEMPSCLKALEGCHYVEDTKQGPCPQVCQTCVQNGTRYKSDQTWNDPTDQCAINECFSGVITRSQIECPAPMCSNPVHVPGQCCPSCDRCSRAGMTYENGETKADITNPCNLCTCSEGRLTCSRKACPVLPCKEHLKKRIPGQCCPVCSRQHAPLSSSFGRLRQMCHFKGKVLNVGSKVSPDHCTTCTCSSSLSMECHRVVCPTLPCAKSEQKSRSGECCPICDPQIDHALQEALPAIKQVPNHCSLDGDDYKNGQTWTNNCRECVCSNGEIKCSPMKCPQLTCPPNARMVHKEGQCCPQCEEGVCTVFGDPHYKTFDGRIFNFQGSCKYLLAKDCSKDNNSTFSIRITNDARDSFAFSWLRTVTVRLEGVKVSLMQKMKVKVDGKRVSLPYIKLGSLSVMKDGYRVVLRTNTGVRILWDGVSFLELTVPPQYQNRLCGLCGNFNGRSDDDFYGRRGRLYREGQSFGDSWRVGGLKACSVLPKDMPSSYEPQCTQSWEKRIQSDRNCNALTSNLFEQCAKKVDIKYFHNACKLDMCECPGDTCHCEVLTAYARECERSGILVHNWRESTGCQNVTSFTWKNHQAQQLYRRNNGTSLNSNNNEVIYPPPPPPTQVEGETQNTLPQVSLAGKRMGKPVSLANSGRNEILSTPGHYLAGCRLENSEFCQPQAQSNQGGRRNHLGRRKGSKRDFKDDSNDKKTKWRARNRARRKQLRKQERRRRKKLRKLQRRRNRRRHSSSGKVKGAGSPPDDRSHSRRKTNRLRLNHQDHHHNNNNNNNNNNNRRYPDSQSGVGELEGDGYFGVPSVQVKSVQSPRGPRLSWERKSGDKRPPFEALLRSDSQDAPESNHQSNDDASASPTSLHDGESHSYQKEDSQDVFFQHSDISGNWSSFISAHRETALSQVQLSGRTPLPLFEGPTTGRSVGGLKHHASSSQPKSPPTSTTHHSQQRGYSDQRKFPWKHTRRR